MTLTDKPLGILDRIKTASKVMVNGKLPNPLASEPEDKSIGALVSKLNQWCLDHRKFWKPIFDRIHEEQKFAAGKQWPEIYKSQGDTVEPYVGDIVQQMVNRKTANLYAKNPEVESVLKDRLWFTSWDGNQQTIDNAKKLIAEIAPVAMDAHEAEQSGQEVGQPPPQMMADVENAGKILQDYQQGMSKKELLQKVGHTGELLIKQQWDSQSPSFLVSGKQAVTRVVSSRVAFIKVMYKRDMETVSTETANEIDFADKLSSLQAKLKDLENNETDDEAKQAEADLLKQSLTEQIQELQGQQQEIPSDEGVVIDWLSATSVLIDKRCKCLKEFMGAHRIAHEMIMTIEEVETKFGVFLRDTGAKIYQKKGSKWEYEEKSDTDNEESESRTDKMVCVWHIEDKDSGLCYVVCDGVKDFLKEPYTNEPEVNRFWSIIPISFNAQEVEENDPDNDVTIYPRSDVRLAMPMQIDINTAGEGLREHRVANRPTWLGVKSKFVSTAGQSDLDKLSRPRPAHTVIMMENLLPNEKIPDYIQPLPTLPIEESMYSTAASMSAMYFATGTQPSDLGAQRPDERATGQNIAAQQRAATEASNIDDLNFSYSTLAHMCWEMLIQEMPLETVKKKVGDGAVWPELNREQIADSIYFQIEAGSMGKPNQAQDAQNFQQIAIPLGKLMQESGLSLEPLIKYGNRVLDQKIDVDDLMKPAQIQAPPAPEQQKPPSVSISLNVKDLPPEEAAQAVEKYYQLKPAPPASQLVNKVGHAKAADAHAQNKSIS